MKIGLEDIHYIITNNYNKINAVKLSSFFDVKPSIIYTDMIKHMGHCLASDILINIKSIQENGGLTSKSNYFAFAASLRSYGGLILSIN